jgi:hypothetical protein
MVDWHTARANCDRWGGTLATITSIEEEKRLKSLISDKRNYWVGLHDLDDENFWFWDSGVGMSYTNWDAGEPSNS